MSLPLFDMPCPFMEVTGIPCPLCGGTRAFVHAVQLDSSFLDYNAVWVFVAVAGAVIAAAAVALRQLSPERYVAVRGALQRTSNLTWVGSTVIVFAIAWAWAIAHSSTIVN
jgi:hypothetical protein